MAQPYPPPGPYAAPPPGPYGAPPPPPQPQVSTGWKIAMYLICFILGFPIGTILALLYVRKKDKGAGTISLVLSLVSLIVTCVCYFFVLAALFGTALLV